MKPKIIIGLGNPDKEYQQTYHNVGCLAVDSWHRGLKTDVYMNKSGQFVREALKKHKAKPEELLIVHDDSDIELGRYKLSFARNSGGHKGIENIINHLKTNKFWRLRIGIRPANEKVRVKAQDLVLKKISLPHRKKLEKVFSEAAKIIG